MPKYPVVFLKPRSSLGYHGRSIYIPPVAQEVEGLDYECELVVVIGAKGRNIPRERALDHVAGYCVGNDISHRELQFQRGGGQWGFGKGFDGWSPYGPVIASKDVIPNPNELDISTRVNGEVMQQSNTREMIFSVEETIEYLSQGSTLCPGDLIFMGT